MALHATAARHHDLRGAGPLLEPGALRAPAGAENGGERSVGKLEPLRRVATRHDERDAHYRAFVRLASTTIGRRSGRDTRIAA